MININFEEIMEVLSYIGIGFGVAFIISMIMFGVMGYLS